MLGIELTVHVRHLAHEDRSRSFREWEGDRRRPEHASGRLDLRAHERFRQLVPGERDRESRG